MDARDQVRIYITDNLLFGDGDHLKDEDSLTGGGLIDSTGVIELVAYLEKTFSITIDDAEIIPENLDTVQQIAHFIDLKKAGLEVPRMNLNLV